MRRLGISLLTLFAIAYFTTFVLILAERGQKGLAAEPLGAAWDALGRTLAFFLNHPATYFWRRQVTPAWEVVGTAVVNSAGLLLAALGLAAIIGIPLGVLMAISRRGRGATAVLALSVLAVSTPSFLLGMLLWIANIWLHNQLEIQTLPPTGFGWDEHLLMPALVLAARPLAQLVQVTYVTLGDVLGAEYIRTAQGKGLRGQVVLVRHALRNALIPILTTLSTSLRFSLSSLPVVEFFFVWPGVGLTLLQAIEARNAPLVTDLVLALGFLFLAVNLTIEFLYPLIDPRVRLNEPERKEENGLSLRARLAAAVEWLRALTRRRSAPAASAPRANVKSPPAPGPSTSWRLVRAALGNPPLVAGTLCILALFGLALFGDSLTRSNPYETHGLTKIDGDYQVPPFKPSTEFPWGSDPVGRDLQALILVGAKQTLALALFGMAARVVVGTLLGMAAAWWRGRWPDRLVVGAVGVWAAFPATLLAMLLILALGIQQGLWVFVVALCLVGWGEIAQSVRGHVIRLKEEQFVEGARAVGARSYEILFRHVLPNLTPSLLVLAVFEFGAVLMLLAELGFLNIFLGGGFKAEVGDTGRSSIVYYFSDVPEWGALLANIRAWWRSHPWLAWYPGLFLFVAILGFNIWGEGLRRFLDQSRVNVSRLFNRFSLGFGAALVVALVWALQSNAPLNLYAPQARQFDGGRALEDIGALASPDLNGREAGTADGKRAAEYIAARMKEIGLDPAGDNGTFIQTSPCPIFHLAGEPRLEWLDEGGQVMGHYRYRLHQVEYIGAGPTYGEASAPVVGLALGPDPGSSVADPYRLGMYNLRDRVVIVRDKYAARLNSRQTAGMLVVTDDPAKFEQRHLYHRAATPQATYGPAVFRSSPVLYLWAEAAEELLETAGSSLAELDAQAEGLDAGGAWISEPGVQVRLTVPGQESAPLAEVCYSVLGHISGTAAIAGQGPAKKLDNQVIVVSAHYDGLGRGPDGAWYPSANDNASGVAEMLEMARVLKNGSYQPKKTIVFAAWASGERWEGFSVKNAMSAKLGFNTLTIEAVLELTGVGAGTGRDIALAPGTSFRLVGLYQGAASQMGAGITTRGRGPHFDLPTALGFGGRAALSAYVSWDGSDEDAHTPRDTFDAIDPEKLDQSGKTNLLVLTVLSRETDY